MGSKILNVIKKAAPIISVAAAPLTGGASLGFNLATAGKVLGIINGASTLLSGQTNKKGTPIEEVKAAQAPTFTPTRPEALGLPASLAEIGSYAPDQQRSALATKGLNQGLGDEENAYYKNLVQRSLIGDGNQVTGSVDSLLPVEQQYFQKQGLNMGDINSFLQGLST